MTGRVRPGRAWAVSLVAALLALASLAALGASPALAASPWWHLSTGARPAHLPRAGEGEIVVTAENVGDSDVLAGASSPVQIVDTLPAGVHVNEALPASAQVAAAVPFSGSREALGCTVLSPSEVSCESTGSLVPYGEIEVRIAVSVEAGASSGGLDQASVSGAGTPGASISQPVALASGSEPAGFGVEDYEQVNEEEGGAVDLQAGSHPFQQTATIALNQTADTTAAGAIPDAEPAAPAKDLGLDWPPGLIANPVGLPACPLEEFQASAGVDGDQNECPPASAVGVVTVTANVKIGESHTPEARVFAVPLFHLEPLEGEPARFAFDVPEAHAAVYVETAVRSGEGEGYGSTLVLSNIPQTAGLLGASVTFWGVPGSSSHDLQRGWGCLLRAREAVPGSGELTHSPCNPSEEFHPPPLLALPGACGQAGQSAVEGDSWAAPVPRSIRRLATYPTPALDGCNRLQFSPSLLVTPDVQQASRPSGLAIDAHVPLEANEDAAGLTSAEVRDLAVTLPEGVTLNPSFANGLQVCTEGELAAGACPDASKIATAKIVTPLLPAGRPLEGAVYLASPQSFETFPQGKPFEALFAIDLLAEEPASGLLIELPGRLEVGGEPEVEGLAPGQVQATFENAPQLPLADTEIHFLGGERALLSTPARCGTYTTSAAFVPWSGAPPVQARSSFEIVPQAGPCSGQGAALGFAPTLAAGPANLDAGSFSPLTVTLAREDGQQSLASATLHFPAGISAVLAGVTPCGEAEANAGTCGPGSEIGQATLSAGVGGDPLTIAGGTVHLTGPTLLEGPNQSGVPFGLSIAVPATFGPLTFQHGAPIVVRAKIEVDPRTAALTVTTGAIPASIEGFPLQIKDLNVLLNRHDFTLNPTGCDPTRIEGTVGGGEGASAPVSTPLQLANCADLKFEPTLTLSTSAATSAASGASLTAKVTEPGGPGGGQANIAKLDVALPKQLSLRQATLHKACASAQFESNPAGCPAESQVGHAKLDTPLLPVALEGPAILVSHAGQAYPSVTIVLQGDGVTIDLSGEASIAAKTGIASVAFQSLPDEPFESFELVLPEGPHSALAANGSLCAGTTTKTVRVKKRVTVRVHGHIKHETRILKRTETVPAPALQATDQLVAQNGAQAQQTAKIALTGCAKAKTAPTRAQKLAKALKACRRNRDRAGRKRCERVARRTYGASKAGKARNSRHDRVLKPTIRAQR